MAEVVLPSALTTLFPGVPRRQEVPGATVREVIDGLEAKVPGTRDRLVSGDAIREHLKVFVDGEQASLDGQVGPRSELLVVLAISGG